MEKINSFTDTVVNGRIRIALPDGSTFDTDDQKAAWENYVGQAAGPSLEHDVRVENMRERLGRVEVKTPKTVTLVMDHGLANFKTTVWPLLDARGLPVTLALNSQKWSDAQNTGTTAADVKTWIATGRLEAANHGRTHSITGDYAHDLQEIVEGRTELETELATTIDTWIQTGNPTYPFADGNSPEKYWNTVTGPLVYRSHATGTGLLPNADGYYDMNGQPVFGAKGGWIDDGYTSVKGAIDSMPAGKGYIVRFHPQVLDTTGKITTTDLTAFLDYLKAEVDAGRLTVLPFNKFQIAEYRPSAVDTGRVALALPAGTAWTSVDDMTVERFGKVVTFSVRNAQQSGLTGNQTLVTLPKGYRPVGNRYQDSYQGTRTWIDTAGNVTFVSPLAQEFLSVTFITQDGPPA